MDENGNESLCPMWRKMIQINSSNPQYDSIPYPERQKIIASCDDRDPGICDCMYLAINGGIGAQ